MNTAQRKVNEKYFIQMMRITKIYTWVDTGNSYSMINNKMKPSTLKGYIDLSNIVSKEFMKTFVVAPDDFDDIDIWNIINS